MRKFILMSCAFAFLTGIWVSTTYAKPERIKSDRGKSGKKVIDVDKDGYNSKRDCDDSNPLIYPGAPEECGEVDYNCDGIVDSCPQPEPEPEPEPEPSCTDNDSDGFSVEGGSCGTVDCNDGDNSIFPGAAETCGDGVDQDCNDGDPVCQDDLPDTGGDPPDTGSGGPHSGLAYADYPTNCMTCHEVEANQMFDSTHYRWTGEAPDMVNSPTLPQGKLTNAVNSYCINIKGDWPICGSCHVGRGKEPAPSVGIENIDCLVCHNEEYAAARTRLPDGSMGVASPTDTMVRNVQPPTRINCLNCHATAGGGDGVKRGDLSKYTGTNSDPDFDVHMNKSGADLSCQKCHVFDEHKVIGKGSDLRPTDDVVRGSEIQCITCHSGKDSPSGHDDEEIGRHVARVACQTCHIPTYAKVATEIHRDWKTHHDGSPADGVSGPGHPYTAKESNLIPEYKFWNRRSDNVLLGDDASDTFDPEMGTYPTSRPEGDIEDGLLYPFKYKTATQPITVKDSTLIALDTYEYLKKSGNVSTAIENGLENMGYPRTEPYTWVDTDTYQLLNHGVNPASSALQCSSCHGNTNRMDLQKELGYGLKGAKNVVCTQCHGIKEEKPFKTIHDKHVKDKRYDCSSCHTFSRPERGLKQG